MSNTISIENRKDIIRDENSKAILKTDVSEKNAWLKKKERNNKIFQNENEINKIRSDRNCDHHHKRHYLFWKCYF